MAPTIRFASKGNAEVLAALFGRLPGEPSETLQGWRLVGDDKGKFHGDPWALQAYHDLGVLRLVEGGAEILEAM